MTFSPRQVPRAKVVKRNYQIVPKQISYVVKLDQKVFATQTSFATNVQMSGKGSAVKV